MAQQLQPEWTPFAADPADELPLGVQLSWRLRTLIKSGRLAPEARLPSVRTLAEWSGLNVNTVRAVYARLEDEGLIETRHGMGTFVNGASASPELERIAADAIAEAEAAGVSARDVAIATLVCAEVPAGLEATLPEPAELDEPTAPFIPSFERESEDRAVRRELRRQIQRLEGELTYYWRELGEAGRPTRPSWVQGHVAGVEELERTRDELMNQLRDAQKAAEQHAREHLRAHDRRAAMLADPAAHRWEVVTAEQTGEPGCTTWQVAPRYGPLGVVMKWWRVKVSGGCPLAAPLAAARGTGG
jgi:DNA-binding transcriptional regulator YhcF (GntR family)